MKHLKTYEQQLNENVWNHIDNQYEEEYKIYIDAWHTDDDDEDGHSIATIDIATDKVTYYDDRAKTDKYAQEMIKDAIDNIDPDIKIEAQANKYNI